MRTRKVLYPAGIAHIYCFRVGDRVKVGSSHNVRTRVNELYRQAGAPEDAEFIDAVRVGHLERWRIETAMHERCAGWRIKGTREWYGVECLPSIREALKALRAAA